MCVDAAYCYRPSSVVSRSVTVLSPAKTVEPIEMPFGLRTQVRWTHFRNHALDGVQIPHGKGQFWETGAHCKNGDFLPWDVQKRLKRSICLWVVDSGRPKETQVQSYSRGGANMLLLEGTLAPPGEYDWTVRLLRRCGLMSNYFDDHLFRIYTAEINKMLFYWGTVVRVDRAIVFFCSAPLIHIKPILVIIRRHLGRK